MPILSARARLAGVIGWPVSHSRSPLLHNRWLERYGIDGAYVPLPVRPGMLAAAVQGLRAAGFAGVNVTLPHKPEAATLCDELTPSARLTGAVNTLVFGETIVGHNTDGAGFVAHLRASGVDPAAGPALLLGAGGAARAIAAALLAEGVPVTVSNRNPERAAALAAALPGLRTLPWEQRGAMPGSALPDSALRDSALLVNTTSLGMAGQPPLPMRLDRARPGLVVADIVYVPLETPLLATARARGLRTVDGLGMLLHQAGAGFAAWFGQAPEVDADVRDLLVASLA